MHQEERDEQSVRGFAPASRASTYEKCEMSKKVQRFCDAIRFMRIAWRESFIRLSLKWIRNPLNPEAISPIA